MKLYNIYLRSLTHGIEIKVGDTARDSLANGGDKHRSSRDNLIGYISGCNRVEVTKVVQAAVGRALAGNAGLLKNNQGRDDQ